MINALINYFSKKPKQTENQPVDYLRNEISKSLEIYFSALTEKGQTHPILSELTNTNNKSAISAFMTSHAIARVCAAYGIDYPKTIYRGYNPLNFYEDSNHKYELSRPIPGSLFIQIARDHGLYGFVGIVLSEPKNGVFSTVESTLSGNSIYRFDRSLNGTTTKRILGYVDVSSAIVDAIKQEKEVK